MLIIIGPTGLFLYSYKYATPIEPIPRQYKIYKHEGNISPRKISTLNLSYACFYIQ